MRKSHLDRCVGSKTLAYEEIVCGILWFLPSLMIISRGESEKNNARKGEANMFHSIVVLCSILSNDIKIYKSLNLLVCTH